MRGKEGRLCDVCADRSWMGKRMTKWGIEKISFLFCTTMEPISGGPFRAPDGAIELSQSFLTSKREPTYPKIDTQRIKAILPMQKFVSYLIRVQYVRMRVWPFTKATYFLLAAEGKALYCWKLSKRISTCKSNNYVSSALVIICHLYVTE